METILSLYLNFVILIDFNIHYDERDDMHGARIRGVFEAYGLRQHINEPTHKLSYTLDLVLTAETTSVNTLDIEKLSDHKYVCFSIPQSMSVRIPRTVISRDWCNFDAVQYELEHSATELTTTPSDDVDYLFSMYSVQQNACRADRQARPTAYDRLQKVASCTVVRRRVLCCQTGLETTGANSSRTANTAGEPL